MSNYTPTTEEVRDIYATPMTVAESLDPDAHYEALEAFDRWYAEEIRKAKEEAWDDGHFWGREVSNLSRPVVRVKLASLASKDTALGSRAIDLTKIEGVKRGSAISGQLV